MTSVEEARGTLHFPNRIAVIASGSEFKEQGQRLLRWVAPDEAARRVREVELKSILATFKPREKKRQPKTGDG